MEEFIKQNDGRLVNGKAIAVERERTKEEEMTPSTVLIVKNFSKNLLKEKIGENFPGCLAVNRFTEKHTDDPKA